jgi:lipopolysaccharide transport system ATP-binding protein
MMDESGCEQSVFFSGKPLRIRFSYRSREGNSLANCRISVSVNSWGKVYFLASTELHTHDSLTLPPEGFIDCIVDQLPLSLGTYYLSPFLEVNGVIQDWIDSAAILQVEDGNFYGTGKDYPMGWEGKTVLVKHRWEMQDRSPLPQWQVPGHSKG